MERVLRRRRVRQVPRVPIRPRFDPHDPNFALFLLDRWRPKNPRSRTVAEKETRSVLRIEHAKHLLAERCRQVLAEQFAPELLKAMLRPDFPEQYWSLRHEVRQARKKREAHKQKSRTRR